MNRRAVLVVMAILCGACGEADPEPASTPFEPSSASAAEPTLADWLPPDTALPRNTAVPGNTAVPPSAVPGHGSPHAGHGATGPAQPTAVPPGGGGQVQGTVRETMDSGGYTYMRVESTDGMIWVAASQREVTVGASIRANGMVMQGFRSNTLNRTFDQLVLASNVEITPAQ